MAPPYVFYDNQYIRCIAAVAIMGQCCTISLDGTGKYGKLGNLVRKPEDRGSQREGRGDRRGEDSEDETL